MLGRSKPPSVVQVHRLLSPSVPSPSLVMADVSRDYNTDSSSESNEESVLAVGDIDLSSEGVAEQHTVREEPLPYPPYFGSPYVTRSILV